MVEERSGGTEIPPVDDNCPICRDSFTVPCQTSCGHCYCGHCILQYWNCSVQRLQPCKCPMCIRQISRLTPEKSLHLQQGENVTKVLEEVQAYNYLFDGDTHGLILSDNGGLAVGESARAGAWQEKVLDLLLFIKRMLRDMMLTGRDDGYIHKACLFTLLLSILYKINIFESIPWGFVGIGKMFDCHTAAAAVYLVIILLAGIYRIRQLRIHVRHRVRLLTL